MSAKFEGDNFDNKILSSKVSYLDTPCFKADDFNNKLLSSTKFDFIDEEQDKADPTPLSRHQKVIPSDSSHYELKSEAEPTSKLDAAAAEPRSTTRYGNAAELSIAMSWLEPSEQPPSQPEPQEMPDSSPRSKVENSTAGAGSSNNTETRRPEEVPKPPPRIITQPAPLQTRNTFGVENWWDAPEPCTPSTSSPVYSSSSPVAVAPIPSSPTTRQLPSPTARQLPSPTARQQPSPTARQLPSPTTRQPRDTNFPPGTSLVTILRDRIVRLEQSGDIPGLEAAIAKLIANLPENNPERTSWILRRGGYLLHLHRWRETIDIFKPIIVHDESGVVAKGMADAYLRLGNLEEAKRHCSIAIHMCGGLDARPGKPRSLQKSALLEEAIYTTALVLGALGYKVQSKLYMSRLRRGFMTSVSYMSDYEPPTPPNSPISATSPSSPIAPTRSHRPSSEISPSSPEGLFELPAVNSDDGYVPMNSAFFSQSALAYLERYRLRCDRTSVGEVRPVGATEDILAAFAGAVVTDNWEMINILTSGGYILKLRSEKFPPTGTAFGYAIAKDNGPVCEKLISVGAAVNDVLTVKSGFTPLMYAVTCGSETVAKALLKYGADCSACDNTPQANTVLHLAVGTNQEGIVREMLQSGADANVRTSNDKRRTAFMMAAEQNALEAAEVLLEYKCDDAAVDNMGWTALHIAAFNGSETVLKLMLEKYTLGHDRRLRGFDWTPLECAAARNHVSCTNHLLRWQQGQGIDVREYTLEVAIENDSEGVIILLLQKGVEYSLQSIMRACCYNKQMALRAIVSHDFDSARDILQSEMNHKTALHVATMSGSLECMEILIDLCGISVDQKSAREGYTALHRAVIAGKVAAVRLLVNKGADVAAVDAAHRMTPLHHAVQSEDLTNQGEIVKVLLSHRAPVNREDRFNRTPLDIALRTAESKQRQYIVELLLQAPRAN